MPQMDELKLGMMVGVMLLLQPCQWVSIHHPSLSSWSLGLILVFVSSAVVLGVTGWVTSLRDAGVARTLS